MNNSIFLSVVIAIILAFDTIIGSGTAANIGNGNVETNVPILGDRAAATEKMNVDEIPIAVEASKSTTLTPIINPAAITTTLAPTKEPRTTTTGLPITTTQALPTTTTVAPTTTTAAPTTTTAAPTTTTTAATTTSTSAPKTTTTAPIPPTPKPTPYPKPKINNWYGNCIILRMAAQLQFNYTTKDNKNATAIYNIPETLAIYDQECTNTTSETMEIVWGDKDNENSIAFYFLTRETNKYYLYLMDFKIHIVGNEFPNALENQTKHLMYKDSKTNIPLKMSYHCTREQKIHLKRSDMFENNSAINGTDDYLILSNVQIEAFRSDPKSKVFSTAKDCDSNATPDIVPIAVGIALISLISVILISYLVARRRSTARGYMSF